MFFLRISYGIFITILPQSVFADINCVKMNLRMSKVDK